MADGLFEPIVQTHHAEIHRYLHRVVAHAVEADHLVQETFLRAFRARGSIPADTDHRIWLFAIATALCRRERRRVAGKGTSADRSATRRGLASGVSREGSSGLESVVRRLSLTQRLAFTMRKLHDLDYDAIGRGLACSAERAQAQVFRAVRRLRRELQSGKESAGIGLIAPRR